jgi:hypothetical protein
MLLDLAASLLVFTGIALGLGWPVAGRLALAPAEKIGASVALSLLGVFLYGWAIYVCSLPVALFWALPALAAGGLAFGRRSLAAALRDADVQALLAAQGSVTLWCLGCLALVLSYSGGGWVADWWGHMQRTWLFLNHWPRTMLFNSFDALTSRPPLANIVIGALLEVTQRNFRHYQLFSTLLSSVAFLPAALLARRFGGARAIAILAVLFLFNPSFTQNATYAWTKLPTAFFVLTALYFFLRAHDGNAPRSAGMLFALSLAAGLLTHYSAGPYVVFLTLGWAAAGARHWRQPAWWRGTGVAGLAGFAVLAVWFGWTLAVFGWHGTFLTNTSVTDQAPTAAVQAQVVALNIRDTLVPHFFRTVDFTLITQQSAIGWWRDWCFNLYQTNFFFAFGSVAWAGIVAAAALGWPRADPARGAAWAVAVAGTTVVGIAVHGARDTWGLAHICLQPLVLLGLALLAARWEALGRRWRIALGAGAIIDFAGGIALQLWVESDRVGLGLGAGAGGIAAPTDYTQSAQRNLYAKLDNHWVFVGDLFAPYAAVVAVWLVLLIVLTVLRARRNTRPSALAHG